MDDNILILSIILLCFKACHMTVSRHINPCENPGNTEAVEHFFNMVFTEFHNNPPACICVQMCIEHPTYCYPNGCLKRPEKDKKCTEPQPVVDSVHAKSRGSPKSFMFLVENHSNLLADTNNYAEEKPVKTQSMELYKSNPFKELVLKYKKIPKLQMKYNLREQVKNMKHDKLKRDQIDVSKTRWPVNRHLLHGKKPIYGIRHYKKNDEKRKSKFLASMFPELASENSYAPKFNDKYLAKRENNNGVKVESLYLYKADSSNFSLESLIDSLIENTFDYGKSKHNSNISKLKEIDYISETNHMHVPFETKRYHNNSDKIISIKSTNETIDTNKYSQNLNMTNEKNYLQMMAIMSEEIDKQNKVSFDLMEKVTGNTETEDVWKNITSLETTHQGTVPMIGESQNIALSILDNNIITTTPSKVESYRHFLSTTSRNVPIIKTPIKSKQRIVRKLRNKINKI